MIRKLLVISCILLSVSFNCVYAATPDSLMNVEYGVAEAADFSYKKLTMDIFFPQREAGKKYPLIVLMHGGGFLTGSKETMKSHAKLMADSGFIAVSINYRKGWNNGGSAFGCNGDLQSLELAIYRATQDARAAFRFLVEKQQEYAIDTAWMFAGGSSAGGVLSFNVAYMTDTWAQQNLKTAWKQLGPLNKAANKYKNAFTVKGICNMWGGMSDSTLINASTALPTILFHGSQDMVVPYDIGRYGTICENYPYIFGSACVYRQTLAAGQPALLHTAQGANHGPKEFWYKTTMSKTAQFFKRVIQGTAKTNSYSSGKPVAARTQQQFDVVVYGGTPGGIAAAIQVARAGKKVVLLEPSHHIGGHMTEGLGSADIDNHKEFRNSAAIGGIAMEFYHKLAAHYKRTDEFERMLATRQANTVLWKGESSVIETIFTDWLKEYKVPVYTGAALTEGNGNVNKKGPLLQQVQLTNGQSFEGFVFIDASYEGDLLHAAGVSTVIGRESNATYGETLNGIRAETKHAQFTVKVDPYKLPGDPSGGLIPTVLNEPLGVPGAGDTSLQAYCFRVCLTDQAANQIAFSKPDGYNRDEYEIYLRYLKVGGKLYTPKTNLPNNKTDLGAWHDLSHNLYGMNRGYPGGSYTQRKNILDYHARFTKGLFYFLASDTAVARLAPLLQQQWRKWGYAKDEFTDNNGFPRQLYVRDARRMVSDYVITEKTASKQSVEIVADPVSVAFWPMDVHAVRRIVKNGFAYNEGFVFAGNTWKPFGISYRALVPRKTECVNLLTPTCPSSSHIAFGAIRLEHNFMDLGQVCAIAAMLALDKHIMVQQVDYNTLKQQLLEAKLIIDASTVGGPLES